MINNKKYRVGSEAQYGPRTVGEILHDFLENSNEPLAVAFRHRKAYATTEPCVDLKLLTQKPGHLPVGECLEGVLTHDGTDHFRFVEDVAEKGRGNGRFAQSDCLRGGLHQRPPQGRRLALPNVPAASLYKVLHLQGLLPRGC